MTDRADELLTLQQAAARLGCHYMTLYRRVRTGELDAVLVGGAYRVRLAELDRWLEHRPARRGAVPARAATRPRAWEQHAERFHEVAVRGDGEAAVRCIERLAANGAEPVEICERVIAPAMARIGHAWQRGARTEAQEHRASAIVEAVLARMSTLFSRPGPRRGTAVVGTPAGERHSLPALMVACALRADGWVVHYLGCDLPPAAFAQLAREEEASIAALSCAQGTSRPALLEAVAELAAEGIPVLVGGPASTPTARPTAAPRATAARCARRRRRRGASRPARRSTPAVPDARDASARGRTAAVDGIEAALDAVAEALRDQPIPAFHEVDVEDVAARAHGHAEDAEPAVGAAVRRPRGGPRERGGRRVRRERGLDRMRVRRLDLRDVALEPRHEHVAIVDLPDPLLQVARDGLRRARVLRQRVPRELEHVAQALRRDPHVVERRLVGRVADRRVELVQLVEPHAHDPRRRLRERQLGVQPGHVARAH